MAMAMDYWRKFFNSAKSDIFELIEKAILVATEDFPNEFKDKRDLIAEKLYTNSQLSLCFQCNNGDDDPKEEKNSSNCGDNPDEEEIHIVGEVMRIKEVLCNNNQYDQSNSSVLYESLSSLQLMNLSIETLKVTEIGRTVNGLRKHNSDHIRNLARTLVNGWKVLVDEWVKSTSVITNNSSDSVSKMNRASTITDYGVGCSSKPTFEQKPSSHLSAGVKRKSKQSEDVSDMSKMEISKRKLHEGYQRLENEKKQRKIQIIELCDLPKPMQRSHEKGRPKKNHSESLT